MTALIRPRVREFFKGAADAFAAKFEDDLIYCDNKGWFLRKNQIFEPDKKRSVGQCISTISTLFNGHCPNGSASRFWVPQRHHPLGQDRSVRRATLQSTAAPPLRHISDAEVGLLCEDNMAKRTARTITKSPQEKSKTSFKSIKKQVKQRAAEFVVMKSTGNLAATEGLALSSCAGMLVPIFSLFA